MTVINSINNKELRNKLIKKGLSIYQKYSWDKCTAETLEFYKKIYDMKLNLPEILFFLHH